MVVNCNERLRIALKSIYFGGKHKSITDEATNLVCEALGQQSSQQFWTKINPNFICFCNIHYSLVCNASHVSYFLPSGLFLMISRHGGQLMMKPYFVNSNEEHLHPLNNKNVHMKFHSDKKK